MKMNSDCTMQVPIEPEISEIVCDSILTVIYGQSMQTTIQVLPADAAKGKTLNVSSTSPMIASVAEELVEINSEGKATITVNGELPGGTSLLFSIENVEVTATARVEVAMPLQQVAAPRASIASGENVEEGTLLVLSCPTEGATIYYTLDGSCPCDETKRLRYTEPIVLDKSVTIKVIAVKEGMDDSDIVTLIYYVSPTVAIKDVQGEIVSFDASYEDGMLTITGAEGGSVRVFDLLGRELAYRQIVGHTVTVRVPQAESYIVSVTFGDGQTVVKKVTGR